MCKLVPPTKSLCLGLAAVFALSGQAAFAEDGCSGELHGDLTNIQFVAATVPDTAVAKARANEIALGVLKTWFEAK